MEKELFLLMAQYPNAKVVFNLYNPESRWAYENIIIEDVLLETEYIEGAKVNHTIIVNLKESY